MPRSRPDARYYHLQTNGVGVAVMSVGYMTLAYAYEDWASAWLWLGAAVCGAGLTMVLPRVSIATGTVGLVTFLTLVAWMGHVALPFGAVVLVPYMAYCLAVFSIAGDFRVSAALLAVALLVPMAVLQGGWYVPSASPVPAHLAGLWGFGHLSLAVYRQFSASRERLTRSVSTLKRLRKKMLVEQRALAIHQQRLTSASEANRLEIDNLTAQLMAEARLMDDLRLRQDDKKSVVHAIHHDLKEPLRSIVSFTQLARRKINRYPGTEALGDYLAFAEDGGRRMSVMLEDLMAYANDADAERTTTFDLGDVLKEVTQNLHDSIGRNGAAIDAGLLFAVEGQRTQMVQLFQNLLSNALKFTRAGVAPRIEIRADAEPGDEHWYRIALTDNGIGIPANQIDKVFGLFNRAHAEQAFEGSGVGLALCRKIVIAHGGQINVTSIPGEGTQFCIRLRAAVGVATGSVATAGPGAMTYASAAPAAGPQPYDYA